MLAGYSFTYIDKLVVGVSAGQITLVLTGGVTGLNPLC